MNYEDIILEKKGHIAKITLNRPDRMNAVGPKLSKELRAAFNDVNNDDDVRVVVITGAGRAFCSGGDVRTFAGGPEYEEVGSLRSLNGRDIISGLRRIEKPVIAMVNGAAVGGGCALALACDIRIGSANARFMNAFVRVGLASGWGGPWLYPRALGLGKALELLLTGDFLEAEEAERIGVLNRLVPADKLEEETMALAQKLASGPPLAIKETKIQVYQGLGTDLGTALQRSDIGELICMISDDHKEGVRAFLEKRPPEFKGK